MLNTIDLAAGAAMATTATGAFFLVLAVTQVATLRRAAVSRHHRRSNPLREQIGDFPRFQVTASGELRVQQLVIQRDFEAPLCRGHKYHLGEQRRPA